MQIVIIDFLKFYEYLQIDLSFMTQIYQSNILTTNRHTITILSGQTGNRGVIDRTVH